jgi:hypothetical protein
MNGAKPPTVICLLGIHIDNFTLIFELEHVQCGSDIKLSSVPLKICLKYYFSRLC